MYFFGISSPRKHGLPSSWADKLSRAVFACLAGLSILLLVGIFILLLSNAWQALTTLSLKEVFGSTNWNPVSFHTAAWGMLGLLWSTAMIATGALVFAIPLGLFTAIFLAEIAHSKAREALKPAIEMIAGVPSVVLGLLGLLYLAPAVASSLGLSNGLNALTASLLVGIATLPSIASICEDSLSGVSRNLREASLALGATRWTTIWRVIVPAAKSGIAASCMLGLGRAIGETVIVLMVAGNSLAIPRSYLDPARPVTATIAIEVKEVVVGSLHWSSLFLAGLLLFLLTFALNTLTDLFIHRKHP